MNAPTLIVGLGGIGSKIALRVADMVTEEQRQKLKSDLSSGVIQASREWSEIFNV